MHHSHRNRDSAAQQLVRTRLALPNDITLTTYDPLAQPAGDTTALAVQKVAASVANIIVVATNAEIDAGAVIENLASEIISGGSSASVDLADAELITTVLTTAGHGGPTLPPATIVAGLVDANASVGRAESISGVAAVQTLYQAASVFFPENADPATVIYLAPTPAGMTAPAWSLKPGLGDDAALVTIDGTGAVRLRASADFETKADYRFTVIAEEGGIGSVETQVIARVTNTNEAPAVVPPPAFRLIAGRAGDLQWPVAANSFSDPDPDPITVTLRVPDGAFAATSTPQVAVGGTPTASEFRGTPAALNAYFSSLGNIRYTPAVAGSSVVEMAIEVFDGEFAAETTAELLVAQLINRPQLRRSTTVRLGGGTMGPQPIAFNYTDLLGASVSTPQQGTRFLITSVVAGTVEKWDGARWVNLLTPITSGSPRELLRHLAFRLISQNDLVRWTPPPNPGQSLTAFRILGWDGQRTSDGLGDITFSL